MRDGIDVVDAFGASTVTVVRPTNLCAPADKAGETPDAPQQPDHLLEYGGKLSPRDSRS